ncbi:antitoxin Xre/MbcA/ParS toxin-binding domain-containing protein [Parahaliea mediterranea]|uniref:antitoxin Xre/MbcA/ParS toxin-binding domain-containing protein n=1 Tax=Parahaliea mediterranea TaxID=651086 RepID=UPI000E2FB0F9|nr:antitoxin Xre/MbcA/ParS toxin-binding domain-containing protein [Parahaliea mediterranea]
MAKQKPTKKPDPRVARLMKAAEAARDTPTPVKALLGLTSKRVLHVSLYSLVERGLPFSTLTKLAKHYGMAPTTLGEDYLGITKSTLSRRRASGRLTTRESDAVVRYARLLVDATDMMHGDEAAARHWLLSPALLFKDRTPAERARTEEGAREVEGLIHRIEHGVFS